MSGYEINVTFSPGCRNNWHIHHADKGGGQILICHAGEGWYQSYVTGNHEAIIPASTVRRYGCAIISLKKNVWLSVVDYLIVHYDGKVEFTFLDGSQIELNK